MTQTLLTSLKNYLKRDESSGSSQMAAPATSYEGIFRTTLTIPHTLGKVPFVRVYYEPYKDGVIYNAQGNRLQGYITKIDGTNTRAPYCLVTPSANSITIELGYTSNALTGNYNVYWVIYKDYAL